MDIFDWLFWNVDTQKDFISPRGKLYVQGAEKLKPVWKRLTKLAERKAIRVVNTCDYHYFNSTELDASPDFVNTFPEHCMAHSSGADFIKETRPETPVIFDWDKEYLITPEILDPEKNRNFVIRKDAFDVFTGNPLTDTIVNLLNPVTVVVYGVTTNICVDAAVKGLVKRVKNVLVVEDAIKELPNLSLPFKLWRKAGVRMVRLDELETMLS